MSKRKKITSLGVGSAVAALELIAISHENKVFAECGSLYGDQVCGDFEAAQVCYPEGTESASFDLTLEGTGDAYATEYSIEGMDSDSVSTQLYSTLVPADGVTQYINNFSSGNPTDQVYTTSVTFDVPDLPSDSSVTSTINLSASFSPWTSGSGWAYGQSWVNDTVDVLIEPDDNTGPVIDSVDQSEDVVEVDEGSTFDLDVTAYVYDVDGNQLVPTFSITGTDSYSASETLTAITPATSAPGTEVNYTFADLPIGEYNWTVEFQELGATICDGYPTQFDPPVTVSGETGFTLGATSTETATEELTDTGATTPMFLVGGSVMTLIIALYVLVYKAGEGISNPLIRSND